MNIRELFYEHVAQTSPTSLAFPVARAEGIYLYDTQGKAYIDFISGIAVSNIGHRHPKVLEAVYQQCELYFHTMVYGEHIQTPQVQLATALTQQLPETLNSVFFVNSGSEATEGALKLAKRYTGRHHIVAFHQSYHGSTHGAMSVNGSYTLRYRYEPLLPDVSFALLNSTCCLSHITEKTAAVIVEPIQGEAGIKVIDTQYLHALKNRCEEVGALLIIDEIQSGFGRTGTFCYFEQTGIVPDIVLLAKGMGGGFPIGAFVSNKKIMETLSYKPILGHITTFGGFPVSCAASLATLQVITEGDLLASITQKEHYIRERLSPCPQILEVRGFGLLLGAVVQNFEYVLAVIQRCQERGLLTDWFLHADNVIRIAPPLTITLQELETALDILTSCL